MSPLPSGNQYAQLRHRRPQRRYRLDQHVQALRRLLSTHGENHWLISEPQRGPDLCSTLGWPRRERRRITTPHHDVDTTARDTKASAHVRGNQFAVGVEAAGKLGGERIESVGGAKTPSQLVGVSMASPIRVADQTGDHRCSSQARSDPPRNISLEQGGVHQLRPTIHHQRPHPGHPGPTTALVAQQRHPSTSSTQLLLESGAVDEIAHLQFHPTRDEVRGQSHQRCLCSSRSEAIDEIEDPHGPSFWSGWRAVVGETGDLDRCRHGASKLALMAPLRRLHGVARRIGVPAVKVAAAGFDLVSRPPLGTTVLIYHRVGGGSYSAVDHPVPLFRAQMEQLAVGGSVIGLDRAIDGLRDCERSSAVVVTFDDGTSDWEEHVLPVLVEFGIPATFYVATAFVDEQRCWPNGAQPVSWAGLAAMASTGLATIGSHSHTHALLDRADGASARTEVERSADLIESHLGVPCAHFAYPKALLGSGEAETEVKRRFRSAALASGRTNVPGRTDPYRLARTPVQVNDGMAWFTRKMTGGLRLEGLLRDRVSARRYADNTW